LNPGDVVVGVLAGALETKVRPAVGIASSTYLVERPDVLVGILTTKLPKSTTSTDYVLMDWRLASGTWLVSSLRSASGPFTERDGDKSAYWMRKHCGVTRVLSSPAGTFAHNGCLTLL
jgi:hypothetical protein